MRIIAIVIIIIIIIIIIITIIITMIITIIFTITFIIVIAVTSILYVHLSAQPSGTSCDKCRIMRPEHP